MSSNHTIQFKFAHQGEDCATRKNIDLIQTQPIIWEHNFCISYLKYIQSQNWIIQFTCA